MTRQTQAEIGALLAAELDHIAPDLERMAHPYRVASEYRRRVEIAEAFVHDMDCLCGQRQFMFVGECPKHYLLRVLQGDE